MQIELVISAIRTRCTSFGGRVAGAAQFKLLTETAALSVPCAFVIPLDDNPGKSTSQNGVRMPLTENFAVVIATSNRIDERGQASAHTIHMLRAELWSALLGWRPTEDHDGIVYDGGSVVTMDRARLWYQFDFSADMEIGGSDGWQDTALAGLPHFDGVNFRADYIDPADPNIANPGPDGRIEVAFTSPQDKDSKLS
jgi:hypothetical protein